MSNLENILEEVLEAKVEAYEATNKVRLMEDELLRVCLHEAPEALTINYGKLCRHYCIKPLRFRINELHKATQNLKP